MVVENEQDWINDIPKVSGDEERVDYSKAWTREMVREELKKNPDISNRDFAVLLSHLFRPEDLYSKAIALGECPEMLDDETASFYKNWIASEDGNVLSMMGE